MAGPSKRERKTRSRTMWDDFLAGFVSGTVTVEGVWEPPAYVSLPTRNADTGEIREVTLTHAEYLALLRDGELTIKAPPAP